MSSEERVAIFWQLHRPSGRIEQSQSVQPENRSHPAADAAALDWRQKREAVDFKRRVEAAPESGLMTGHASWLFPLLLLEGPADPEDSQDVTPRACVKLFRVSILHLASPRICRS